jgi:dienelactone hydrolase
VTFSPRVFVQCVGWWAAGFGPVLVAAGAAPVLYEEALSASAPIRIEQWKQLQAYADRLPLQPRGDPALQASAPDRSAAGLRQNFRGLLGFPPPEFLAAPTVRKIQIGADGTAAYYRCFVRVGLQLDTYGLWIVPKTAKRPLPLVVALHGGSGYPELATFHGGSNYHDMVRGAVASGYAVFAPLTLMWPARDRDQGTPIPPDVRTRIDEELRTKGATLMGVEVAKISRALDSLLQDPEIDRRKVAVIGLSYGGYYALYAAALDPRLHVVVASGCFSDRVRNDPRHPENPRRPIDLSSVELARLISPRPLQVQAGIRDSGHSVAEARRAALLVRGYYPGSWSDNFDFEPFDGVHEFRGDLAWRFLQAHLR